MPPIERNTRTSKIGFIPTLKTQIQEDPQIVPNVLIFCFNDTENPLNMADFEAPNVMKRTKKWSVQRTRNMKRRKRVSNQKRGWWEIWKNSLKYKGDWLQEVQGTLMLVATVIATVTFQGAIDPPGGIWQQDVWTNCSWKQGTEVHAQVGTAIMACKSLYVYIRYFMANSISFLASVSVILLIVSGFPLKNRVFGGLLTLAMCVAVACLAFAYVCGSAMVNGNQTSQSYLWVLLRVWYGIVGLVTLCCVIIPFLIWAVKTFVRIFTDSSKVSHVSTAPCRETEYVSQ
ncbi:uncharacterized protein LOC111458021 [Cucurbita moschata]|uniref:Uncharacterized protein LOC111458021 n=1 Tax=Cucurbita moschata TaxID=3662 RepID=A0A6J1GYJ8_CUCMO|nr:uncharacterized protein LOC111458021 [Cucurbita moschata]